MKIIFAGTPQFAADILENLINKNFNIIACLTQEDKKQGRGKKIQPPPVKISALKHNIPILQANSLKNNNAILNQLNKLKPDLMIVVAYGIILRKEVLTLPKFGCINVHASILPQWRGAAPIQYSILKNNKKTGISIMKMDEGLDTGPVFKIKTINIEPIDTTHSLTKKLTICANEVLVNVLNNLENINPQPQDNNNNISYAYKINKSDGKINWEKTAIDIDCKIRAFNPWPIAYSCLDDQIIRIYKSEIIELNKDFKNIANYKPGCILQQEKNSINILTTDNKIIRLLEIQLPGKKIMPVSEILKSKKDFFQTGKQFI